jgi:hypothetical protein
VPEPAGGVAVFFKVMMFGAVSSIHFMFSGVIRALITIIVQYLLIVLSGFLMQPGKSADHYFTLKFLMNEDSKKRKQHHKSDHDKM